MKLKNTTWLLLLLAALFSWQVSTSTVSADSSGEDPWPEVLRFGHLTAEDGLPSMTVLAALQDQDGFIWFGTQDGLGRYDGYSIKVFRNDEKDSTSISANNIFALYEDAAGTLWIGTDGGGLNLYHPETESFTAYRYDEMDETSLSNDSIWSVLGDTDGNIWVGTRGGLNRFDPETEQFERFLHDEENPNSISHDIILRIYQDSKGTLWFGTRDGLSQYQPASNDFQVYLHDEENENSLSDNQVWDILEDSHGNYLVGTRYGGLNQFDPETGEFFAYRHDEADPHSISDDHIWDIYEDQFGVLWIATERGGINRFDSASQTFLSYQNDPNNEFSINDNDIFMFMEDESGNLWMTSRRNGVNFLSPSLQRFSTYRYQINQPLSLSESNTYAIWSENESVFWVGTSNGLNRVDRALNQTTIYQNDPENENSLSANIIYALWGDGEGTLWIGTVGGGLSKLDLQTEQFTTYGLDSGDPESLSSNYITALAPAGDGRLWVGTLGLGLDLFDPKSGKVIAHYETEVDNPNSLSESTVYALAVDEDGQVYVGTARGGLSVLNPASGVFTNYLHSVEDDTSIANDGVQALLLASDGSVWCGTANGLSKMNIDTGQFENYLIDDGLLNQTIFGVLEDNTSDIWVSTGSGLAQISQDGEIVTYDLADGLQSNLFNLFAYHRGENGELFFGGPNGVNSFCPSDMISNAYAPVTNFIDFQLFNRSVDPGSEVLPVAINEIDEIILSHEDTVFTIGFSATNYQVTEHNVFQYKMEGFDKEWSPPSAKREATYTNLSPGTYNFLVRAANNDGLWSQEAAALKITVTPPWWETIGFQILLLAFVSLLIFGVVRWRFSYIQKQNESLEQRVKTRTIELEKEVETRRKTEQELLSVNMLLKDQLEEISLLRDQLHELAIRDELTGLYNRRYLNEVLDRELARGQRENQPVCALIMDIDWFKTVNDTYGHVVGDQVLARIGALLQTMTRQMDVACRYGGEEFMVVLPGITVEEAMVRAEEIREKLHDEITETVNISESITLSVGLACFPDNASTSDELLNNADIALYEAKRLGRNQMQSYQPTMREIK